MNWVGKYCLSEKSTIVNIIFRIVYELAPNYLTDLLKPCILPETIYPLRSHDGLTFIILKLEPHLT